MVTTSVLPRGIHHMAFSVAELTHAKAFRISPKDTNYFAVLFDQVTDRIGNIFVIEIFKPGGATPPNEHAAAHEFFHVLHGEGVARHARFGARAGGGLHAN